MIDRYLSLSWHSWTTRRPSRLLSFIATVCLAGAALLALSQVLGRNSRPRPGSQALSEAHYRSTGETARRSAEDHWRIDVSKKLEEILDRVPYGTPATDPATD